MHRGGWGEEEEEQKVGIVDVDDMMDGWKVSCKICWVGIGTRLVNDEKCAQKWMSKTVWLKMLETKTEKKVLVYEFEIMEL